MANTYLTRSISSGSDLTKWTWSCWVKRTDLVGGGNNYQRLISNEHSGDNNKAWYIRFQSSTQFHGWVQNSAFEFTTNGKYRDINGWYHLVVKYDSTQSTQSNRLKVYVNGEEPSMSAITYPSQNQVCNFMNSNVGYVDIGYYRQGSSEYFHGLMSHMHFTAGYAYDASAFGETDATTGEWKIKINPSVTYGSLGFFILKDGNSVTDQSGNGNNFTVGGGTLTKTEDCPSNVFCTLSPLHKLGTNTGTYSNGNTKLTDANGNWQGTMCTLGATSGKYYWEYQLVAGTYHMIGVMPDNVNLISSSVFDTIGGYSAYIDNGYLEARYNNADISGWSKSDLGNTTFSTNDYINIAVDMDNKFMYIGKNGTWLKSGDPTSGSSGTGGINISATFTNGVFMIPVISAYNGTTGQFNFGNGYMGTTAVSSAGTNASGNGIFEYDVPTGYTALSTKGLNL